jgi:hypothetical protein
MNKPSEQENTITSKESSGEPDASELTDQELDKVAGGAGKAASGIKTNDESPKETVTFEYGGLLVNCTKQNPDGKLD